MDFEQLSEEAKGKAAELSGHLFGIVLKTLFLLGFLVLNVVVQPWIKRFEPDGILELVEVWTMRVLFAVITLAPLFMMLYRDLMILWIRNQKKIESERSRK